MLSCRECDVFILELFQSDSNSCSPPACGSQVWSGAVLSSGSVACWICKSVSLWLCVHILQCSGSSSEVSTTDSIQRQWEKSEDVPWKCCSICLCPSLLHSRRKVWLVLAMIWSPFFEWTSTTILSPFGMIPLEWHLVRNVRWLLYHHAEILCVPYTRGLSEGLHSTWSHGAALKSMRLLKRPLMHLKTHATSMDVQNEHFWSLTASSSSCSFWASTTSIWTVGGLHRRWKMPVSHHMISISPSMIEAS